MNDYLCAFEKEHDAIGLRKSPDERSFIVKSRLSDEVEGEAYSG